MFKIEVTNDKKCFTFTHVVTTSGAHHLYRQRFAAVAICLLPEGFFTSYFCTTGLLVMQLESIHLKCSYMYSNYQISSVTQSCPTLQHLDCSMPDFPVHHQHQSLLKFMSIKLVMPSNHLIFCCPLFLLLSIFPSFRVFSKESVLRIKWPSYWSLSFSISPSNEYSGLISFRMDWLDLLAVQGTLKSLQQHHSSKASILWCPAFFIVLLSNIHT